jgi:hypothetical protein
MLCAPSGLFACSVASAEIRRPETAATAVETASGEQAASCMSERQVVDRFVSEKLATWQRRLKLENWTISTVMTRRDALKPKTLGGIRWDKHKKTALISLLDPSDYRLPFREMLDDLEFTIVHELVHLELASLPRSEASRSSEEHAVNQLAEALLGLDRER